MEPVHNPSIPTPETSPDSSRGDVTVLKPNNNGSTASTTSQKPTLEEALQRVAEANTELAAIKKKIAEDAGVTWDFAEQTEDKENQQLKVTSANPWSFARENLPDITESPIFAAVRDALSVSPKEAKQSWQEIEGIGELFINLIGTPEPEKVFTALTDYLLHSPYKSYKAIRIDLGKRLQLKHLKSELKGGVTTYE